MKKIYVLVLGLLLSLGIVSCTGLNTTVEGLSTKESLASLSFISAGFLDMSTDTSQATQLAVTPLADEGAVVEENLEEINQYVELLKNFIEQGTSNFGQIDVVTSDRAEFAYQMNISVQETVYVLYYNVDATTGMISGIFVIGDVEYTIEATNSLADRDEFESEADDDDEYDDEDEDEYDDDDAYDDEDDDEDYDDEETTEVEEEETTEVEEEETTDITEAGATKPLNVTQLSDDSDEDDDENESEYSMELIARNGEDYIEIRYEVETEGQESETRFEIEKYIGGVESESAIEIRVEEDEYKIEIEDGDDYYEFKQETEEEGTVYKLEYEVNGVEGEIKITEMVDELGETVYIYEIEEEGNEFEVEQERPESRGFDDESEDEEVEDTALIV